MKTNVTWTQTYWDVVMNAIKRHPLRVGMGALTSACIVMALFLGGMYLFSQASNSAPSVALENGSSAPSDNNNTATPANNQEQAQRSSPPGPTAQVDSSKPRDPQAVLKMLAEESWPNPYKGYVWRKPIDVEEAETIFSFREHGMEYQHPGGMTVDVEGGYVYWTAGAGSRDSGAVRRCKLDGSEFETLVKDIYSPISPVLDIQGKKLYWSSHDWHRGIQIQRSNFDGSDVEVFALLPRNSHFPIAFDSHSRHLYWTGDRKIMRVQVEPVGKGNAKEGDKLTPRTIAAMEEEFVVVPTGSAPTSLTVDTAKKQVFLTTGTFGQRVGVWQINIDEKTPELLPGVEEQGPLWRAILDNETRKIFWLIDHAGLFRSDLDGTQVECLVTGNGKTKFRDFYLDLANRQMYWMTRETNQRIQRAPIPEPFEQREFPAPPHVRSFAPLSAKAGEQIRLTGSGFTNTEYVKFIDSSTGENVNAEYRIINDNELTATVPQLRRTCAHAVITVQTPSGITVATPSTSDVFPTEQRGLSDGKIVYDQVPIQRGADDDRSFFIVERGRLRFFERSVALGLSGSRMRPEIRGYSVLFGKNGCTITASLQENNVIYYEPYAIHMPPNVNPSNTYIPVPAIRASLVGKLFEYRAN